MWLTLIIVGIILVILGVATDIGMFLVWLGAVLALISVVMTVVRRGTRGV